MVSETLNEREFELINIVGAELAANQRDLSRRLRLSLGMTNMLLRRLIAKGYIRIQQLDKRKVTYLLTPRGFSEKMRKSMSYTLKTIRSIGLIKEQIREMVVPLYNRGERTFGIIGTSDFALLIDVVFKEQKFSDYYITYLEEVPEEKFDGVVLICKESVDEGRHRGPNCIDLIRELAKQPVWAG